MLVIILMVAGCTKSASDINGSIESSSIVKAEGPATANVNQEIIFNVTLKAISGCAKSGQLQEKISGNAQTISGKVLYEGQVCAQVISMISTPYVFKAAQAGTYTFKFLTINNTYLSYTVQVN